MVSPMPATLTSLPDEIFDKVLAELSLGEILSLSDAGHFPLHARSRIDERIASLEEAAAVCELMGDNCGGVTADPSRSSYQTRAGPGLRAGPREEQSWPKAPC